jgi:ADP-heptose:LPS heptosyltransferase
MSVLAGRAFRRILIIKPSSPGDIIHALPVLHGLRKHYPDAHLAWLVATPFRGLIEADPALDEVIPFDRKRFGRLAFSVPVAREFLSFVRRLRQRRFDLVIDLQGLFRSGFLAFASGAGVRVGFRRAREAAGIFYTHKIPENPPPNCGTAPQPVPPPPRRRCHTGNGNVSECLQAVSKGRSDRHAADQNYDVARMLGFGDLPMDFTIALRENDRQQARRLLEEAGFRPGERYVVLVPATRWETKCWPPERFGHLANLIQERRGLGAVLVGGGSDIEVGDVAVDASMGTAANLCGRTTLRQLAAIIDGASLVVTADSTPMHMAAALGRPLIALFGPTNPDRTGPYGRPQDVLRADLDCSPCYLRTLRQCPHGQVCMKQLSVERVLAAVRG